jgi:hypothetical protein
MHGDFSRLTYTTAPLETDGGFAAVLGLQGRLTLEADANENVAIMAHFLRTLVTDLVGPAAGPAAGAGFAIQAPVKGDSDIKIGAGHYYVGGLLVRTEDGSYLTQPSRPLDNPKAFSLPQGPTLAYLKVWERLITAVEDPRIREVALGAGGPDTAARSKVVWEVVLADAPETGEPVQSRALAQELWSQFAQTLSTDRGRLRAAADTPDSSDELCAASPGSQYRGVENQLYRVEIHCPGEIPRASAGDPPVTFKWSRDNGSVVSTIEHRDGNAVTVSTLGRDDRLSLDVGDWVEIVDDHYALAGRPAMLHRVADIDPDDRLVTLDATPKGDTGTHVELHPFLRRWDQDPAQAAIGRGNAIVAEGGAWMELEDGIVVRFENGHYRSGDFWTIPARVETGDVIWPFDGNEHTHNAAACAPEGITYSYAPLAYFDVGDGTMWDLRCIFPTLGCMGDRGIRASVDSVSAATAEDKPAAPAAPTRRRAAAKPKPKPQ